MSQVFYQVGIGIGTIVSVSALKSRRDSIVKGVIFVPIGILVCGLLSATTVFSYLSHFCVEAGLDINDAGLTLSGP
jgi:SNF family Na+-dependent transporter